MQDVGGDGSSGGAEGLQPLQWLQHDKFQVALALVQAGDTRTTSSSRIVAAVASLPPRLAH